MKYKYRTPSSEYRNPRRYGQGWFLEPTRHSLARRGIRTGRKSYAKISNLYPDLISEQIGNTLYMYVKKGGEKGLSYEDERDAKTALSGYAEGFVGSMKEHPEVYKERDIKKVKLIHGELELDKKIDYAKSQTSYDFFSDPAHGWIKVKRSELERLGIADKISGYSYQKGDYVYLEEDADGTLFADAKKAHNEPVNLRSHIADKSSKIRSYDSYSGQVPINFEKKDWKKRDCSGSFADYGWHTPDSSLSISSTQDRDGKNAFMYYVTVMSGLTSLGGVNKKTIWKGRDEKLALIKANEYMEKNLR
jgi:hypothetical protein